MAKVQCSGSCHIWSNSWISGKNPDHTAGDSVYFWFGQYPWTFRSKFVELIIEKSTIFCKESYNKASMSSEISDILFCNTFSVFAVLVQAGSWQPKHTNHHDVLWPYLIKILILQLWRKVFFLLSGFSQMWHQLRIIAGAHRFKTQSREGFLLQHRVILNTTKYCGHWKILWLQRVTEKNIGRKKLLKTMKHEDSIFDCTAPRSPT